MWCLSLFYITCLYLCLILSWWHCFLLCGVYVTLCKVQAHNKMAAFLVCVYVHRKTNFSFSAMLCRLDWHWCSYLRHSDTSSCPRTWLEPIGALFQALEAHTKLMGKIKWSNNGLWHFSLSCLWVHCCIHNIFVSLSVVFSFFLPPSCYFSQSALIHWDRRSHFIWGIPK